MSKIIYQPKGKAGEYAKYAANFYTGCSGRCDYCYNRTGITAKVLGGDTPTLKKCLGTVEIAEQIFMQEADMYRPYLMKHGLFFNFVSDPFLPATIEINTFAMRYCILHSIPVIALTKQIWWVADFVQEIINNETVWNLDYHEVQKLIAIGFTLTGHNELEPGCATNEDRIRAMKVLHDEGFKTWASIEPIIDLDASWKMITEVSNHCDLMKIGLWSGAKYDKGHLRFFMQRIIALANTYQFHYYFKDSILKAAGHTRDPLGNFEVDADYNLFTE
jgi:DNA repair photolyase